jgi:D-2-hydroxyacid dehydrogenase (NADP+)
MATTLLLYDPDTPSDARVYAQALAREVPAVTLLAASDLTAAIAAATPASVLIAKAQDVSAALIAAMPKLTWIQALTTGVDSLQALEMPATVTVTTARGIHGPQMAELALLYMMCLYRDIPRMLLNQRHANWQRWGQRLLLGRTVVIVGVGSISETLAARCKAFGLRVIGITRRREAAGFDELYPRERLREAAARADFMVLVTPYTSETHHMIDAAVLAAMPKSAYVINIARGRVIDEAALIAALQSGGIAGAALDVFDAEPLPKTSPLWSFDNVIVTPHIGGMSDIYAEQILPLLLHNLRAFLAGDLSAMRNRVAIGRADDSRAHASMGSRDP